MAMTTSTTSTSVTTGTTWSATAANSRLDAMTTSVAMTMTTTSAADPQLVATTMSDEKSETMTDLVAVVRLVATTF